MKSLNDQIAADRRIQPTTSAWAKSCTSSEKWPEAAAAYQKTLDLDPNDVMAMSHLGTVLIQQDKLPEAVSMLEKAEALEKDQVAARKAKGEEGNIEDINIPERLYEGVSFDPATRTRPRPKSNAKDIDLQHVAQQFLLVNSEKYFMEKDKKDVAQQFMDDGTRLGAKINPKLKEGFFNELVFESWFGAMQDKQHPERMAKVQAWLDMLAQALMKTDPTLGIKLAMELQQLEHPPSPKPSGSGPVPGIPPPQPLRPPAAPASSAPSTPTTVAPAPLIRPRGAGGSPAYGARSSFVRAGRPARTHQLSPGVGARRR